MLLANVANGVILVLEEKMYLYSSLQSSVKPNTANWSLFILELLLFAC